MLQKYIDKQYFWAGKYCKWFINAVLYCFQFEQKEMAQNNHMIHDISKNSNNNSKCGQLQNILTYFLGLRWNWFSHQS